MSEHTLHYHHILPRHAGGTDDESNLYPLTVTQHALAHRNRWILTGDTNDYVAWKLLRNEEVRASAHWFATRKFAGVPKSEEFKRQVSKTLTGVPKTQSHATNISAGKKGRYTNFRWVNENLKGKTQPQIVCPHCGTSGGFVVMDRHHMDNCKHA